MPFTFLEGGSWKNGRHCHSLNICSGKGGGPLYFSRRKKLTFFSAEEEKKRESG